jgi:cytochrome c oxidase subunit 1
MTTFTPTVESVQSAPKEPLNYLNAKRGFLSWALSLDHKRIGIMYMIGTTLAFVVGGLFALMLRLHLWKPEGMLFVPDTYNQVLTLHGIFMVFFFIIPAIPGAMANFALPLMLGAKDVALPRLNLASFYLWLIGVVFATYAIINGGIDTGWTFYTPYSIYTQKSVIAMGFGVFMVGFSSIFTGLNFVTTVHKMRAPGLTWFKLPLFIWGIYATSILQVLATPVLGITLLLLVFERLYGMGFFDPMLGGDPVMFQHFFWFYSHPAVYIMILPAMAIISDVVSVHARKPLFGYKLIAFSSLSIAIISFLVWGHHMFTSGQSEWAMMTFSFLTFFVGIPTAIKVFNWVATIWKGSIALSAPMFYALAFIIIFIIGGLTGIMLAAVGPDLHLHDTYYVVAHFHYVMMGSTALGFFAGIHHWWPQMWGRMYSEFWARIAAVIIFIGFNLTFFPQFIMGSQGMMRRYATYVERWEGYHHVSTIGAGTLGVGFALMLGYLTLSLFKGEKAKVNHWGGVTLDWMCPTPPLTENFKTPPVWKGEAYDYVHLDLKKQRAEAAT